MVNWKNHRKFLAVLASFTFIQLAVVVLRWDKPLIWDSSVYVGMGKYIFSIGEIGLWESFRPPVIPFLIGLIWKTGLFFPSLARLVAVGISASGVTAFYKMIEKDFDLETAFYAAAILMSTYVFLRWSHYLLTGIPAAILVYASIYYARRQRVVISGSIASLAFLTRFPAALVAPVTGATLLISIIPLKNIIKLQIEVQDLFNVLKKGFAMAASFSVIPIIYFILNHYYGGGFISHIVSGASVPMLNPDKYLYGLYFFKETIVANPLLIFAPIGIYFVYKTGEEKFYGYFIGLISFYLFFTFYPHKEPRFMLLFLPLMTLFAANGIKSLKVPDKHIFTIEVSKKGLLILILSAVFIFNSAQVVNANTWENPERNDFLKETSKLNGTVAGLNPAPVVYGDFKYMAVRPEHYENTTERVFRQADYFVLNTCSWYCTPAIERCERKEGELLDRLEDYNKIYEGSNTECNYAIYRLN